MSCRSVRADRGISGELHKRLNGIIILCTIISDVRTIGKADTTADTVHIILDGLQEKVTQRSVNLYHSYSTVINISKYLSI